MPGILKSILEYLFPATLLWTFGASLYFIALSRANIAVQKQFDQAVAALLGNNGRILAYIVLYLLMVSLLGWRARWGSWRTRIRWLVESGSRRGLSFRGVLFVDLLLVLGLLTTVALVFEFAPDLIQQTIYFVGPLVFALVVTMLFGQPRMLDDVITRPMTIAKYVDRFGLNLVSFLIENHIIQSSKPYADLHETEDIDELSARLLKFGERVKLPPDISLSILSSGELNVGDSEIDEALSSDEDIDGTSEN
jgi:hypothetical protein